jgi:hypothetical protein
MTCVTCINPSTIDTQSSDFYYDINRNFIDDNYKYK